MEIELFKFAKRINSTKRPSTGSGFTTQCTIKQNAPYVGTFGSSSDTTVCFPVLFLTNVNDPNQYNYCRTFGNRYYFIKDVQVDINGAATLHCEIDVLATRKEEILASTQYVLYSSSNYNLQITDSRQAVINGLAVQSVTEPLGWDILLDDALYIVTGISEDRPLPVSYLLDTVNSAELAKWISDPANLQFQDELRQFLFSPADAITSIKMTRLDLAPVAQDVQVTLGHIGTTARGKLLHYGRIYYHRHHISLTNSLINKLDYTYGKNYSTYSIELPYCGVYQLPADEIYNYGKDDGQIELSVDYHISATTGEIVGFVFLGTSTRKILEFSGNCMADIPWGSQKSIDAGATIALATAALGMITGTVVATGAATAGINEIATTGIVTASANSGMAVNSAISGIEKGAPQIHSTAGNLSGYMGAIDGYFDKIKFIRNYRQPVENIEAKKNILGLPCNKVLPLSSLSGFCQCKSPSIEINDLKMIAELINSYLSGGFFIE